MPGKLTFITQKIRSNSVPLIDSQIITADCCETVREKESEMSETEMKNAWFKTWPERNYDKLDQTSKSSPEEDEENGPPNQFQSTESQVPLNKILDKIPLAYSPITKQLHVLSPSEQQKIINNKNYQSLSKSEVLENSDSDEKFWTESSRINGNGKKLSSGTCFDEDNEEERLCSLWNSKIGYSEQITQNSDHGKSDQCVIKTEASSFSSIVSSLSDNSPSNIDENNSGKLSLLDNDDLSIQSHCSHDSGSTYCENSKFFEEKAWNKGDNKRKGFSGFFSRNVFVWKSGTPVPSQGWKLFGKASGHDADDSESSQLSNAEDNSQHSGKDSPVSAKKYEDVIASSSALILHNRPANLPAKSLDEEQKHRLEYEQMVEAARKKELKESKKRKKQLQQQLKFEEQLANASRIWNSDILPRWDTMRHSKKARELWWAGIPPSARGKVWKLAIGNELNITYQLYEICVARAQERLKAVESNPTDDCAGDADKESSVELIQLDISRTFPQLCIFQKGGPYYDILHCLLGAYVCYRPDVGYVQGMSFIAAILILNLEPADAFICFANLLNRSCHMSFFSLNQPLMHAYYDTYDDFFRENLPKLCQHFQESSLTPDLYLLDWVYSVFAKAMPLDIACRVWDVFLRDGEEFLFRTALGILHLYQEKLMKLDFINGAQFLTKLPEDMSPDALFKSIDNIKMCAGKMKFSQVLVLITGSSRGIGLELTRQFVTHHDPPDTVIATCRNPDTANELRDLGTRFNNLILLQLDVNKIDTFPSLVERVDSIVGENGLNVLINNAGIISRKANLEDVLYDDYLNVLHTNTVGPVFLTQALLPLIKRAAALNADQDMCIKRAAVINVSSMMGSVSLTTRGYWGYSESKAALNQASRLLSSNVSMHGILVVVLHPGWVKTQIGGHQAHLTVEESVANLMEIIYNLSEYSNDTFLRFDGEEIPW